MGLRKFQTIIALLLLGAILVTGCKDGSSDSGELLGSFEYNGTTYSLEAGAAFDFGEITPGFRNYDFVFTEKEENFENEEVDINSGHYLYIWLESMDSSSFSSGTFTFDDSDSANVDHMYAGGIALNVTSDGDEDFIDANGGSVTLDRSGNSFDFTFNLVLEDGEEVTGSFSAELEIIDGSDESLEKRNGSKRAFRFLNK